MWTTDAQGNSFTNDASEIATYIAQVKGTAEGKADVQKVLQQSDPGNKGKKQKGSGKQSDKRSAPAWEYNVPVLGDGARAQDDWNAGNYGSYAVDQITGVTTGVFLLEMTAENTTISAFNTIEGWFTKDAAVQTSTKLLGTARINLLNGVQDSKLFNIIMIYIAQELQ